MGSRILSYDIPVIITKYHIPLFIYSDIVKRYMRK